MGKLGAVIVAAGKGTRMGTKESKQYLPIGGKPILIHTLEAFERAAAVDEIVLVVGAGDLAICEGYRSQYGLKKLRNIVAGGGERQQSVYEGLLQLRTEWVLVHDGVRPFVSEVLIDRCYMAAMQHSGAVAAVPVKDTIKVADGNGRICATPDRTSLWAVQTPQVFRCSALVEAHQAAFADGFIGTDDASIAERAGIPVQIVQGDYDNIKITTPDDLAWAEYKYRSTHSRMGESR